jgi:general secretion pathway protein L
VYATPADYEAHRETIEGLRERAASLQVKLMPEGPLPLLAAQAVGTSSVNLLQGSYVQRSSTASRIRQWRLPAALAAASLLLFLVTQGISVWRLSRAEKTLDAQITEVFKQALPGQPVVDPRAQMQGVLGSSAGKGALLPALSVLATEMQRVPTGRVEGMSYRGNALDLKVVTPTIEALDGIKQAMVRNGIDVELTGATPRGPVVEGRLQIKLGAA